MKHLPITPNGFPAYDVLIGQGLLDRAGTLIQERIAASRECLIIADEAVHDLYGERLSKALSEAGHTLKTVITLPQGEGAKSTSVWAQTMEDALAVQPSRSSLIIALGGGVCGDHAGFVAASLLRGVHFVQIPTTLLAQVDSSIGGKTGLNAKAGKNLIGAFHHPALVISDTSLLSSLSERDYKCGYAELVKHAIIDDADLFDDLALDIRLEDVLERSCQVKARIVAEDAMEKTGRRALLNFGHTFAHALEADLGYDGRLLHGEAVALGMLMATELSVRLGQCPAPDQERIAAHFEAQGLLTHGGALGLSSPETLYSLMQHDKKRGSDGLVFVTIHGIGKATLTTAPDKAHVLSAMEKYI